MERPIDEHDVTATLDAVESIWLATVEGNCEIFQLAAHYADLCSGDGLPPRPGPRVLPGTERSVQLGGEGTPRVAEFAAVEFGARMRMGARGARHLIADALDARHRLPLLYARVCAGEVRVPWVRHVAAKTRDLSMEAAARIDADMVECADGRLPWSRFCERLEGRIVAADPEAARRREEEQRREVFARATRYSFAGMKGFYLRGAVSVVVRFDATVAYLADALKALGDTDDEDARRVKACAVLANPMQAVELLAAFAARRSRTGVVDDDALIDDESSQPDPDDESADMHQDASGAHDEPDARQGSPEPRRFRPTELPAWLVRACDPTISPVLNWPTLLPQVHIYLHLAEETIRNASAGVNEGAVRWDGEGPVTLQYVRDHLAPYHSFKITPIVDLAGQEPVDSYEIPRRHRQAVRLRTPADCFPFAANLGPVDVDHTRSYERGQQGQSRMDNYGPLGRFHHRVKTHGGWQVAQPFDGIYVWRDPHGQYYLVDHTGTRKLTSPQRRRVGLELHLSNINVDFSGLGTAC